jgi:hypothetical protein
MLQYTKTVENIPIYHKIHQMAIKYIKWPKNWTNVHKINHIFHFRTLQNLPKFIFLVWKCTIWQPCALFCYFHKKGTSALSALVRSSVRIPRVF